MLMPLAMTAIELEPNQLLLGHYTTDDIALGGCWGKSLIQGVRPIATDLTPDELAFFQNSKIVAFRVGLSESTPVTRVFVIPINGNGQLGEVVEWPCEVSDEGWNIVTLDTPYLINLPDDYQLRIGFDYEQTRTNKPISAVNVGTIYPTYVYRNNWTNYGVNTIGNLSLQLICENDNFPTYAIRLRNLHAKSMIKTGDPLQVTFQACNMGIAQIDAGQCTFRIAIDGEDVATTTNPTALTPNYSNVGCTIPTDALNEGLHTLTVTVATANGEVIENPMSLSFTFKTFNNGFSRQMRLVEQFTSTYCRYCPLGTAALAALRDLRGDIAWVGVHQNMSGTDVFRTAQCDSICNLQLVDGYPEGSFDRTVGLNSEEPNQVWTVISYNDANYGAQMFSRFLDQIAESPSWATVNVNSTFDADTRKAVVTIDGELVPNYEDYMGSDSRLTVYITEDGLVAPQYDDGTWINDYVHNGVLRKALVSVKGVALNKNGNSYKNEFTVDIPNNWVAENLNIVAFISRPLGNPVNDIYVTNANKRKLGEFDEPEVLRGDVDGDGRVNIDDVSLIIDCLLSGQAPANPEGADCYPDGIINIDDLTMIIDYLVTGTWAE